FPAPGPALFPYTTLFRSWSKEVLLGQAAWLFRSGAIHPGKTAVDIPVSAELRIQAMREKANYRLANLLPETTGLDLATVFTHRVDRKSIRLNSSHDQISY